MRRLFALTMILLLAVIALSACGMVSTPTLMPALASPTAMATNAPPTKTPAATHTPTPALSITSFIPPPPPTIVLDAPWQEYTEPIWEFSLAYPVGSYFPQDVQNQFTGEKELDITIGELNLHITAQFNHDNLSLEEVYQRDWSKYVVAREMPAIFQSAVAHLNIPKDASAKGFFIVGRFDERFIILIVDKSKVYSIDAGYLGATMIADPNNQSLIARVLATFRIRTPFPPLSTIAPEFWATAGIPSDTQLAVQTSAPSPFGDIATRHIDDAHLTQLTSYGFNADPALSPDGQIIAYRSIPKSITSLADPGARLYADYYNIWLITVDGTQAWQLTASEMRRSKPNWSPDGRKLTFSEGEGSDSILVEVEADSRLRHEIIRGAISPRYRPDGSGIGYVTPDGGLTWIDGTGDTHAIILGATLPISTTVYDFDWLPDGQRVVYTLADMREPPLPSRANYSVWIVGIDGTEQFKLADPGPFGYGPRSVKVSPDGQVVSVIGSSYADFCAPGESAAFLLLGADYQSAQLVLVDTFEDSPKGETGFYPVGEITWVSSHWALASFGITCPEDVLDNGRAGTYLIEPVTRRLIQIARP